MISAIPSTNVQSHNKRARGGGGGGGGGGGY